MNKPFLYPTKLSASDLRAYFRADNKNQGELFMRLEAAVPASIPLQASEVSQLSCFALGQGVSWVIRPSVLKPEGSMKTRVADHFASILSD